MSPQRPDELNDGNERQSAAFRLSAGRIRPQHRSRRDPTVLPSAGGWTVNPDHPKAWLAVVAFVIGVGMFVFSTPLRGGIRSYLLLLNIAVIFPLVLSWIRRRRSKSDNSPDRPYKLIE